MVQQACCTYDIVTCLDVLEHIELSSIDAVISEIKSLTRKFCYIVVDLQPAVKTLSDGRNAHILLAPPDWWTGKFSTQFPAISSFPILHHSGIAQKVVICCANDIKYVPFMYMFIIKMKLFDLRMTGGPLGAKPKK